MTPWPTKLEMATGTVNGFNQTFNTSLTYEPGSLRVWEDGVLLKGELDDGFDETGAKEFQMKIAPKVGSKLQVFYTIQL